MARIPLRVWLISSNVAEESVLYKKLFRKLEEKLNIRAELRFLTWNKAYDTIIDAFKNNVGPDVFSLGTTWVHTLNYLGYIAPVPLTFKVKPCLAEWMKDCIESGGTNYAVPFLSETYVLLAKKRPIDILGINAEDISDWDGFSSVCGEVYKYYKSIGNTEHIPFAHPIRPEMGTTHRLCVWLFKAGWKFPEITADTNEIFCNDVSKQTLNFLSKLLRLSQSDIKPLNTDRYSIYRRFLNTDQFTFFVGNATSVVSDILNKREQQNVYVYPVPSLVPSGKTFSGGSVLTVSSQCIHPESAWNLVECLTEEDVLSALCALNGYTPPYDSGFWSEYDSNPIIQTLKKEHMNSATYFFHPLIRAIEQITVEHIAQFFWESFSRGEEDTDTLADQTIRKLDEGIIDLLNMMWETR